MIDAKIEGDYLVIHLPSIAGSTVAELVCDALATAREKTREAAHWKEALQKLADEWQSDVDMSDAPNQPDQRTHDELKQLVADLLAGRMTL